MSTSPASVIASKVRPVLACLIVLCQFQLAVSLNQSLQTLARRRRSDPFVLRGLVGP